MDEHAGLSGPALREHLVAVHGRAPYELGALPLDAVHALEHLDDALGLLHLAHHHPATAAGAT